MALDCSSIGFTEYSDNALIRRMRLGADISSDTLDALEAMDARIQRFESSRLSVESRDEDSGFAPTTRSETSPARETTQQVETNDENKTTGLDVFA